MHNGDKTMEYLLTAITFLNIFLWLIVQGYPLQTQKWQIWSSLSLRMELFRLS